MAAIVFSSGILQSEFTVHTVIYTRDRLGGEGTKKLEYFT